MAAADRRERRAAVLEVRAIPEADGRAAKAGAAAGLIPEARAALAGAAATLRAAVAAAAAAERRAETAETAETGHVLSLLFVEFEP